MVKGDKLYYKALNLVKQETYDYKLVIRFLQQSIKMGNKKAAYALASWYLNGFHVRKNYKKAFKLLQMAVQGEKEKGFLLYKDALYDIAICYELGQGVSKDVEMAYYYYLLAAFNGDTQAIKEVSRCLYFGIGVFKNTILSNKIDEYLSYIYKDE